MRIIFIILLAVALATALALAKDFPTPAQVDSLSQIATSGQATALSGLVTGSVSCPKADSLYTIVKADVSKALAKTGRAFYRILIRDVVVDKTYNIPVSLVLRERLKSKLAESGWTLTTWEAAASLDGTILFTYGVERIIIP